MSSPAQARRHIRLIYATLMVAVMFVVLAVCGVIYTNHTQRVSDRRWCELLTTLTEPIPTQNPSAAAPVDPAVRERQLKIARQLRQLHAEMRCTRVRNGR